MLTRAQVAAIRETYATGDTTMQPLADTYNIHITTVWQIIRNKIWYDPRYTPPQPDRRVRLTWERVRKMRTQYATGRMTMLALADEHGVSKSTVSRVITNETWHDPDYIPPRNP